MRQSSSLRAHIDNQQGIALVASLLLTLLLTLVVLGLAYRVQMFSVGARENVVKSQNLYTADIGLNQARYFMLDKGCVPPNWSCIPSLSDTTFTNMSTLLGTTFTGTRTPALTYTVGGQSFTYQPTGSIKNAADYTYKVYAKKTAMPNVINILSVVERPGNPAQTVIDAGLIFVDPDEYAQSGSGRSNSGQAKGNAGNAPAVNTN